MVLWSNIMLVIQPLQNVLFKLVFFAVFGTVIVQALSTAGFTSDKIIITVPDSTGNPYPITVGGMARKLDALNDPTKVGEDI